MFNQSELKKIWVALDHFLDDQGCSYPSNFILTTKKLLDKVETLAFKQKCKEFKQGKLNQDGSKCSDDKAE